MDYKYVILAILNYFFLHSFLNSKCQTSVMCTMALWICGLGHPYEKHTGSPWLAIIHLATMQRYDGAEESDLWPIFTFTKSMGEAWFT